MHGDEYRLSFALIKEKTSGPANMCFDMLEAINNMRAHFSDYGPRHTNEPEKVGCNTRRPNISL